MMLMRWFRRLTLQARLTFIGTAGAAASLAVGGLIVFAVLNYVLVHSIDQTSRQTAREVAQGVAAHSIPANIPRAGTQFVQVIDDYGNISDESDGYGAERPGPVLRGTEVTRAADGEVIHASGSRINEIGDLRIVAQAVEDRGVRKYVIVAAPTHSMQESVDKVRLILLIAYPLMIIGLGAFTWRVVSWSLRPVEELRQGAAAISASGRRVGRLPVPDGEDEVSRLAVTLNDMLNRLDEARARQRAFVADAAHELRSPLASLRTQLEVAAHLDEPPVAEELLTDVGRLGRLVDDLLLLARADEYDPRLRLLETVDVRGLASTVADSFDASARVSVTFHGPAGPLMTVADPGGLRRVLDNLVGNAVKHAATRVRVTVAAADPADERPVRVTIADDGPGIPAEDRERVFDRFTRLDNSRVADGGAGLGLAIVRELLRLYDGAITLSDANPGLRVDLALPGATSDEDVPVAALARD